MAVLRDAILAGIAYALLAALCLLMALVVANRAFGYPLVAACDANQDGVINSADLGRVAEAFGEVGPGDINLDGRVNSLDIGWCGRLFGKWAYPDDGGPDDSVELPTVTTEGLSLEAYKTAQAGICPECGQPSPTQGVPTP